MRQHRGSSFSGGPWIGSSSWVETLELRFRSLEFQFWSEGLRIVNLIGKVEVFSDHQNYGGGGIGSEKKDWLMIDDRPGLSSMDTKIKANERGLLDSTSTSSKLLLLIDLIIPLSSSSLSSFSIGPLRWNGRSSLLWESWSRRRPGIDLSIHLFALKFNFLGVNIVSIHYVVANNEDEWNDKTSWLHYRKKKRERGSFRLYFSGLWLIKACKRKVTNENFKLACIVKVLWGVALMRMGWLQLVMS